jgi:hypothetical protein
MARVKYSLILLLGLLAACGGGENTPLIVAAQTLTPVVTITTVESVPGTLIHGVGLGPGGGDTCGNIEVFDAYRTDTRIVFRIEDEDGFCFGTDIYEVVLNSVVWKGTRGRLLLVNDLDPRTPGNVNGAAYFIPEGAATAIYVSEISVSQWMDDPADTWLFLAVPLSRFSFAGDDDTKSVFETSAQIERVGTGVIDWTDPVNVDFVDP